MKNLWMVLMGKVYSKDKKGRQVILQERRKRNLHGNSTKIDFWYVQNQACRLLDQILIILIIKMSNKLVNHAK